MTDSELLELAAKAAGIKFHAYVDSELFGTGINTGELDTPLWNPLIDDGDALRLAVKLEMRTEHARGYAVCYSGSCAAYQFTERWGSNPLAATRRAIVRAAAEIGRAA